MKVKIIFLLLRDRQKGLEGYFTKKKKSQKTPPKIQKKRKLTKKPQAFNYVQISPEFGQLTVTGKINENKN